MSRRVVSIVSVLPLLAAAGPAFAQSDPAGSGPLLGALQWVQGTLMGTLATTAAVIAVALVGFMMLTGRMEWRRAMVVIFGAFVVFGAGSIVAGLKGAAALAH